MLNSKNPIVLAGGGGWNEKGRKYLKKFVERENLPFIALFRYQDIFDNYSPCYIGDAGVGMAGYIEDTIKNADVILSINGRFGEMTTKGWSLLDVPYSKQKIIHSHSSDLELGKIIAPEIAVHAGPNEMAKFLFYKIKLKNKSKNSLKKLKVLREKFIKFSLPPKQNSPVDMSYVMKWLQNNLDE